MAPPRLAELVRQQGKFAFDRVGAVEGLSAVTWAQLTSLFQVFARG